MLPCLFQINDWPDLKFRGVLWDVSSGRIPTLVSEYVFGEWTKQLTLNWIAMIFSLRSKRTSNVSVSPVEVIGTISNCHCFACFLKQIVCNTTHFNAFSFSGNGVCSYWCSICHEDQPTSIVHAKHILLHWTRDSLEKCYSLQCKVACQLTMIIYLAC